MADDHKTYELVVAPREARKKKTRDLLREEKVPGVVYGHNVPPQPVVVPLRDLEKVYLHVGNTSLVDLKIGDGGSARKVFIHEVQRDRVTHGLAHVDFMVVNLSEPVTATIQVVLMGEAPAVVRNEGMLLQALDHVPVHALPTELPSHLEVDISGLREVDDAVHVSDIKVPKGVQVMAHPEDLIAKVEALRIHEEAAAAEEEAAPAGEPEGVQPPGEAESDEG